MKLRLSSHARCLNGRQGKSFDRQIAEILHGSGGPLAVDFAAVGLTAQHGHSLEDQQVRRRKFTLECHQLLDLLGCAATKQEVYDRRGVEYCHSPRSRIERTATSLASAGAIVPRVAIREASSAGVGRAALRASKERRYSEKETPDAAARAFSV